MVCLAHGPNPTLPTTLDDADDLIECHPPIAVMQRQMKIREPCRAVAERQSLGGCTNCIHARLSCSYLHHAPRRINDNRPSTTLRPYSRMPTPTTAQVERNIARS